MKPIGSVFDDSNLVINSLQTSRMELEEIHDPDRPSVIGMYLLQLCMIVKAEGMISIVSSWTCFSG